MVSLKKKKDLWYLLLIHISLELIDLPKGILLGSGDKTVIHIHYSKRIIVDSYVNDG